MKRTVLWLVLGGHIVSAFCQVPASALTFEVASIKVNKSAHGIHSEDSPGHLQVQGTLKGLVQMAYGDPFSSGLKDNQVEGGPKWLDQDYFDIDAKADGPAQYPQLLEMLQTLLAERFKLEFHRETKLFSGYALVVGKNGLKMAAAAEGAHHSTNGGSGKMTAENVSMSEVAMRLSRLLGMPVLDETGNSGFFDFKLTWAPEKSSPSPSTEDVSSADSDAGGGPSIFTALQEQLGLKLEPRKVPFDVIVVDRADKPSEN